MLERFKQKVTSLLSSNLTTSAEELSEAGVQLEESTVTNATQPSAESTVNLSSADNSTELTEMASKMSLMEAQLAAANTALAEFTAEKVQLANLQKEAKLQARKSKLEATVGTVKAPELLASLESLDDAAFSTVVDAMAGAVKLEADTGLFQDSGSELSAPQLTYVERLTNALSQKQ